MTISINDLHTAVELDTNALSVVRGAGYLDIWNSNVWDSVVVQEDYDGEQRYDGDFDHILENFAIVGGVYSGGFNNSITMLQTTP